MVHQVEVGGADLSVGLGVVEKGITATVLELGCDSAPVSTHPVTLSGRLEKAATQGNGTRTRCCLRDPVTVGSVGDGEADKMLGAGSLDSFGKVTKTNTDGCKGSKIAMIKP